MGIVGACGRGGSLKQIVDYTDRMCITAVCDVNEKELPTAMAELGAERMYTDYDEMLRDGYIDAVFIGTPMPLHVPQAVAALSMNIHVISEVPAGVSIDECRTLVEACDRSEAVYLMAENYIYTKHNLIVGEMVRAGAFGDVYYAEGEYIHELKELNETTRWRRKWQTGINGITYGTHSLGPVLQWMAGDRVTSVSCVGSGHHYRDPRGAEYENEDSCVMMCKTGADRLIKIRVDMLSDRPHCMNTHQLQGTDGVYESSRGGPGDQPKVWMRRLSEKPEWSLLDSVSDSFTPDVWKGMTAEQASTGHDGGDFVQMLEYAEALLDGKKPRIGIHEAMDLTLPGLISQESILRDGEWLPVPDSREWTTGAPK